MTGTPYEGRVSIHLTSGDKDRTGGHGGTQLDAEGRAVVQGVQPGDYNLHINVKSGRHRNAAIHTEPVTVRAGENKLRLSLPTLYTVTVHGASGSCHVSQEREPGKPRARRASLWGEADSKGVATFDTLLPGTYRASSGRKRATFTVPGTREVTLEEHKRGR